MKYDRAKKLICLLLALALTALLAGCGELSAGSSPVPGASSAPASAASSAPSGKASSVPAGSEAAPQSSEAPAVPDENGTYTAKEDVALYIHTYGHLPSNFVTKAEAKKKGWEGGSLESFFPGCSIGGDRFGNYEGLLPKAEGRTYTECDIDTKGASSRGAKRIVFSNDGLVYYTDDHYQSFTLLYGEG